MQEQGRGLRRSAGAFRVRSATDQVGDVRRAILTITLGISDDRETSKALVNRSNLIQHTGVHDATPMYKLFR